MSDEITDEALNDLTDRHDYWDGYLNKWMADNPPRANGVEKTMPHKAITALMLLEKGETRHSIQTKLGWNWTTVSKFEARHTQTIQENRKHFSRKFAMTAEAGLDVLHKKFHMLLEDQNELKKADVKGIAIAVGVMTDKGLLADGMATSITETRKAEADVGDALQAIIDAKARAAQKIRTIEAEIVQ